MYLHLRFASGIWAWKFRQSCIQYYTTQTQKLLLGGLKEFG